MDRQNRAKQFMPFDALKGLKEELRKKEMEKQNKIELCEDRLKELEKTLENIKENDKVKVTYYTNNRYSIIEGKINMIDYAKHKIQVDETEIFVDNIYEIELNIILN